jgi:hypothetical protein
MRSGPYSSALAHVTDRTTNEQQLEGQDDETLSVILVNAGTSIWWRRPRLRVSSRNGAEE